MTDYNFLIRLWLSKCICCTCQTFTQTYSLYLNSFNECGSDPIISNSSFSGFLAMRSIWRSIKNSLHNAKTHLIIFLNAGCNMVSGGADAGWSAEVLEVLTSNTADSLTESGLESPLAVFCSHLHQRWWNTLMGDQLHKTELQREEAEGLMERKCHVK